MKLEGHRLRRIEKAHAHREILIGAIGVLEELRFQRNMRREKRTVVDVALELITIDRPAPPDRR
jgi:hypothetical protein